MSFSVEWRPSAEKELARLWVDHPAERNAITAATAAVEAALCRDPQTAGESRGGRTRLLIEGPIWVTYDVFASRRRVIVRAIWKPR
jgi:hypothetical protein